MTSTSPPIPPTGKAATMTGTAHSLAVMTYGSDPRYYSWRCTCGVSGHGEAPAGSSKEDVAGRAWHDHDASRPEEHR